MSDSPDWDTFDDNNDDDLNFDESEDLGYYDSDYMDD